jgi:CheY-like chemotaxis protein
MMDLEYAKSTRIGMDLDELSSNPRSKVLLIDDEYDTVQLLKAILRMAGFDVISAMNGAEALKKLASYQPDLILLDLMMPTMGGWEIGRASCRERV